MILKEYTVKKTIGTKTTIKTPTGGFDSTESNAEVSMTFTNEGTPIDPKEANKAALHWVEDAVSSDPDWIKNSEPKQQTL